MRVLAIGAHPDDVEIGCGGALLAHRAAGDEITLLVMTEGNNVDGENPRIDEQVEAARLLGAELLWGGFEDGSVPAGKVAVDVVEAAIARAEADVVYTHTPNDTHQDHRATAVASIAAARKVSRVLCYESPTAVAFSPNVFVNIGGLVEEKLDLIRCHISQVMRNGIVDLEALEAQARFRGFGARAREAEGFEVHRYLLDPAAIGLPGKAGTAKTGAAEAH
jgi:LmbE family N-acetylglucosaminyl deacetylase